MRLSQKVVILLEFWIFETASLNFLFITVRAQSVIWQCRYPEGTRKPIL